MNIYTKAGDGGETRLLNGEKVNKADSMICLLGEIDELTSHLGVVRSKMSGEHAEYMEMIQKNMISVCSYLADNGNEKYLFSINAVKEMEKRIDNLQLLYPVSKKFVIPGDNADSAETDVARTVARRAERTLSAASETVKILPVVKAYFNRLSDYLFVLARYQDFSAAIEKAVKESLGGIKENKNADISLLEVKRLMEKIEQKSLQMKLSSVIAVCNKEGNTIAVHVMDGAFLISYDVAVQKAYSAAAMKMATGELYRHVQPGGMFYGLDALKGGRICAIVGGVPLHKNGQIVGALGVSGGTDTEDGTLAEFGKTAWEKEVI